MIVVIALLYEPPSLKISNKKLHWCAQVISDNLQTISILYEGFGDGSLLLETIVLFIIWTMKHIISWIKLLSCCMVRNLNIKRKLNLWTLVIWLDILIRLIHLRPCLERALIRIVWELLLSYSAHVVVSNSLEVITTVFVCRFIVHWNIIIAVCSAWSVSFEWIRFWSLAVCQTIPIFNWIVFESVKSFTENWFFFVNINLILAILWK